MWLKKISLLIVSVFTGGQLIWSQSSIYISPSGNLFISSGTLFFVDSLALLPSVNLNITGENAITRNATVTHGTVNPYIKRVFHFLNTTSPFSGSVTIYYNDAELNGLAENTLTLNVHNGISWNAFPANVVRDGVNNFVTTSGLSNLSLNELTLAGLSGPLPVHFTFVNASCTNGAVTINWQTATEVNSRNFEIQSSATGNTWTAAGTVPAAGNSSSLVNYSFTITNPGANHLYRIVQYDLDGSSSISRTIRPDCTATELLTVYPNPVHTSVSVTIKLNRTAATTLQLYDAKGRLVKTVQRNLLRGVNQVGIDIQELPAGIYILAVQWDAVLKHVTIIKQ
jgi:hypothetical protein